MNNNKLSEPLVKWVVDSNAWNSGYVSVRFMLTIRQLSDAAKNI